MRLGLAGDASASSARDVDEQEGESKPQEAAEDSLRSLSVREETRFHRHLNFFCVHELSQGCLAARVAFMESCAKTTSIRGRVGAYTEETQDLH